MLQKLEKRIFERMQASYLRSSATPRNPYRLRVMQFIFLVNIYSCNKQLQRLKSISVVCTEKTLVCQLCGE